MTIKAHARSVSGTIRRWMPSLSKNKTRRLVQSFLIELVVYAALVVGYFFLVLHFLGGWLKHLFDDDKKLYAFVALGLMIGQGVLLEMLTGALLRAIRSRT